MMFIVFATDLFKRITAKEINQLRKYLKNLDCKNGILVNFYETLEIYEVNQETSRKV